MTKKKLPVRIIAPIAALAALTSGCSGSAYSESDRLGAMSDASTTPQAVAVNPPVLENLPGSGPGDGDAPAPTARISQVFPPQGKVSSIPSAVDIVFTQEMDRASIEDESNYQLRCDNGDHQIKSAALSGKEGARVELYGVGALKSGEQCLLVLSSAIRTEQGASIVGKRIIRYELWLPIAPVPMPMPMPVPGPTATTAPTPPKDTVKPYGQITYPKAGDRLDGVVYAEALALDSGEVASGVASVTYFLDGKVLAVATKAPYKAQLNLAPYGDGKKHTLSMNVKDNAGNEGVELSPVKVKVMPAKDSKVNAFGGGGGSAFDDAKAPDGASLVGFDLRYGGAIDQVRPIWASNYGAREQTVHAKAYGGNGGNSKRVLCPDGARVSGMAVTVGDFGGSQVVKALALYCKKLDGTVTTGVPTLGGSGVAVSFPSCGGSSFVHGIHGGAGKYLNQIGVYCR